MLPNPPPRREHLARLMNLWRSAGWPCRDALEIDLLAAGWVAVAKDADGRETLRLTDAGIRLLAEARQRNRRALSRHDRLAARVVRHLRDDGRIVWRELSLRALANAHELTPPASMSAAPSAFDPEPMTQPIGPPAARAAWRIARPDVFSLRNTSVEAYLHPVVHEVKASRADLLSDLRHADKRESYRWLCCECYYVFPHGVAEAAEIPEPFGVWVQHGDVDDGRFEIVRPARHAACTLPFAVWLALAKSVPEVPDDDPLLAPAQAHLGEPALPEPPFAGPDP